MLGASQAVADPVRIASYHTELSRDGPGLLLRDIVSDEDPQALAVIRVIQAANADVIVLAGVDYDLDGVALNALADRIGGYPYRFSRRPNRGMPTGLDLDGDGRLGGPGDAQGFGEFAGQSGMAVLSRFPIATDKVRDFSGLSWRDLPGTLAPADTPESLRLSTTVHWDVPVVLKGGRRLHLLTWHATPPVFQDGNRRRNHDEAALWLRYLNGMLAQAPPDDFILLGQANVDPADGDGDSRAVQSLIDHPLITDPAPASVGGSLAGGGVNARQRGDPGRDTADWPDEPGKPGNLRVDYVLPAARLTVVNSGVLWPLPETSLGRDVLTASRHRLVWVDLDVSQGAGDGH